jgi:putative YhbY family RNA-binding protein
MTTPLLTADKRRALRAEAHHLDPVVMIGNDGLTPAVLHEIDVNLLAHGLIKIRVFSDDRAVREALLARIAAELDAAPVQHIGKLLVVYRPIDDAEPVKPARRPASAGRGKRPAGRASPGAEARAPRGGVAPRTGLSSRGTPRSGTPPRGGASPRAGTTARRGVTPRASTSRVQVTITDSTPDQGSNRRQAERAASAPPRDTPSAPRGTAAPRGIPGRRRRNG